MPFEEVTIGSARLIRADCLEALSALPAESVHCCVTSPPYFGLRDYGVAGQIGLEPTPAAYIAKLVEIMRGVRRVLRKDGTLWLVIGDSYSIQHQGRRDHGTGAPTSRLGPNRDGIPGGPAIPATANRLVPGLKPKDLTGIPWMLAFALRDDGWYLRRDIIWHKPNPMPESVTDRPTTAHEYVFLLTKSARYFYDGEAIKEPVKRQWGSENGPVGRNALDVTCGGQRKPGIGAGLAHRNKRSVWTICPKPFREAHFATFPPALVEPCILAGTSERGVCPKCAAPWERVIRKEAPTGRRDYGSVDAYCDLTSGRAGERSSTTIGWSPTCSCSAGAVPATVIDPFAGASTTALVADRLGRRSVSIELSVAYHDIACARISAAAHNSPVLATG